MSRPPTAAATPASRHRRRRRAAAWMLVATLTGVVAAAAFHVPWHRWWPRDDYDRFQGHWRVVVGERDTPLHVQVVGRRWEYLTEEGSRAYSLELDMTASPRRLQLELLDSRSLIGPVPRLHGLYAFEGPDRVRLCLLPALEPLPADWDGAVVIQTLLRQ